MTPAVEIAAPSACTPRASSRSIQSPDSRVSRPMMKRSARPAVAASPRIARTSAAPSRATVS